MADQDSLTEQLTVEVPSGTRALLEKAAADNFTTPEKLAGQYIRYGVEQANLQRQFDVATDQMLDW